MKFRKSYDHNLLDEIIKYEEKDIDWKEIFKSGKPLIIEIGCGNGHFLINKAKIEKEFNYIGIDKKSDRLIRCREKEIKHQIDNIKWIHGDAFNILCDMFDKDSIAGIYMLFPDPWPKRKHHKKRLFNNNFIDIIFDKLKPNGFFLFVTDHKEYYEETLSIISENNRFVIKKTVDADFSISLFGDKWQKENKIIYKIYFEKTNG